ncbi:ABC transporter permease [Nonomuraea rhizosphaerae]|uniref:ABC transporter permease n=1 Tax=Nonomuraea rhizosphaerae TaxID=2665663 RepID=UPI001C5F1DD2|nr:ABC transporter permease [Nonomuraea rhizosphaerae]
MSTAETEVDVRRTPGLVPVTETMRTVEREPGAAPAGPPAAAPPPSRPVAAFWRLLGSELGLTFRRPRNQVMLAVLASVPLLIGIGLRIAAGDEAVGGLIGAVAGNSLMLTFVSFSFLVLLLMPVSVAVVGGDSVAGEAGAGTLRYLLAAPAGRTRLLAVKYLNAVLFAYAVTIVVALSALVTGLVLFPVGPVTLLSGSTVSVAEGLLRILVTVGYVGAGMAALAAIAVALSTFTEVSIGAIAATMVLVIVAQVIRAIPQLDFLAPYLLPTWWTRFDAVLRSPIDLAALGQGLLVFGAYIGLFCSIAWARFTGKDITS